MRFLGIDYGTKRIGLAISDENKRLAFPNEILLNDFNLFKKIGEVIKRENITEIIVGESTNFKGQPNILSKEIEAFILKMGELFQIPIHKQKEFLTSVEARGREGKSKNDARKNKKPESKKVDSSAAALILQRFLDKRNKNFMI